MWVLVVGNPGTEFSETAGNSPSFHILFFCFWASEDFERVEEGEEADEHRMTVVCLFARLIREVGLSCWGEGGEKIRDEIDREADVVAIVVCGVVLAVGTVSGFGLRKDGFRNGYSIHSKYKQEK